MTDTGRPVLLPEEIVPFFINVVFDSQRLCEIVQVRLCDANPEEIAMSLVHDLSLSNGFKEAVLSLLDNQIEDFKKLTQTFPCSEYYKNGSAVHILSTEVGLNTVVYSDRFEWDIFDYSADPDVFARLTGNELGLPHEFINVISAQIRWQVLRLRAMHAQPERLEMYIQINPIAAPQTLTGLRGISELIDASPAVGLIPGVIAKKATASRDRTLRYLKRQGHAVSKDALQPAEDTGVLQVKLVPIVRANPMPEDGTNIDLASVPLLLSDQSLLTDDVRNKVRQKMEQMPFFISTSHLSAEESDDGFGNDSP